MGGPNAGGGLQGALGAPFVIPITEEPRLRGAESWGTPKFAPSTRPTWRSVRPPHSRTSRAGVSAARIARDCGLFLLIRAHRPSGIGQRQPSTKEGKQRGASYAGSPGRARRPGGSHSVPAPPGPLAARIPPATLPSSASSLSPGQSAMGAGCRNPSPPPQPGLPPPPRRGSAECARAEPAALGWLPCQILPWRAAPSRAGGSRQPRLGSCPSSGRPRARSSQASEPQQNPAPGAGKGGREAPRSAAKYFSRPVGSARLHPDAACPKPLGKLAIPSDSDP